MQEWTLPIVPCMVLCLVFMLDILFQCFQCVLLTELINNLADFFEYYFCGR
jgi:hypothetical protein